MLTCSWENNWVPARFAGCVLRIGEHELIVDLIALDLKGYDVIFGMDLLSTFRAVMDCFRKRITLQLPGGGSFQFH